MDICKQRLRARKREAGREEHQVLPHGPNSRGHHLIGYNVYRPTLGTVQYGIPGRIHLVINFLHGRHCTP